MKIIIDNGFTAEEARKMCIGAKELYAITQRQEEIKQAKKEAQAEVQAQIKATQIACEMAEQMFIRLRTIIEKKDNAIAANGCWEPIFIKRRMGVANEWKINNNDTIQCPRIINKFMFEPEFYWKIISNIFTQAGFKCVTCYKYSKNTPYWKDLWVKITWNQETN